MCCWPQWLDLTLNITKHNTTKVLPYLMFPLEGEILHFRRGWAIVLHPVHGGGGEDGYGFLNTHNRARGLSSFKCLFGLFALPFKSFFCFSCSCLHTKDFSSYFYRLSSRARVLGLDTPGSFGDSVFAERHTVVRSSSRVTATAPLGIKGGRDSTLAGRAAAHYCTKGSV